MIIERKYVSFYRLSVSDPKAKEIFEGTIKNNINDPQWAQHLIDHHYSRGTMVYGATMDYCIPRFDIIKEGYEALDKVEPYDNGWDVTDARRVDIVDKGEDYIDIHLIKVFDGEEFIIKVDRIYNE